MPFYENVFIARQDVDGRPGRGPDRDLHRTSSPSKAARSPRRNIGACAASPIASRRTARATTRCSTSTRPPAAVTEMERNMRINEDVLRYLTVRVDALEEAPSAMLRAARDERDRPPTAATGDDRDRDRAAPRARRTAIRSAARRRAHDEHAMHRRSRRQQRRRRSRRRRAGRSSAAARPARSPAITRRRSTTRT